MSMYLDRLKSLLSDGGITPGNTPRLAQVSKDWFEAQPSVAAYAFYSIFREFFRDWGYEQAVPTAEYAIFEKKLLPQLLTALDIISRNQPQESITALDGLVRTLRDCYALSRRTE
jgi:hypothetical protein